MYTGFLSYKIVVIGSGSHQEVAKRCLEDLNVAFYNTLDQFLREFGPKVEFPLIVIGERGVLFRRPFRKFKEDNSTLVRSLVISNRPLEVEEADDYLLKPLNGAHLRRRVEAHLGALEKVAEKIKAHVLGEVFDTAFASAPIGITVSSFLQLDFNEEVERFDYINPKYLEIVGRDREEILTLDWPKFTHPEDLEEELEKYKRLQSGEVDSYSMEKRYIKPDGSIVWVSLITSVFDLNPYRYVCIVQDITKTKEYEFALAESERSKTSLLSHIPGMAYRCRFDRDWTMEYISEGCKSLTGYPPGDLLYNNRLSFNSIVAPEFREKLWDKWNEAIETKRDFELEYQIIDAQGRLKWVMERGQAVYPTTGDVVAIEGIILDISKRKESELNLLYYYQNDPLTGLYNRQYFEHLLQSDSPHQKRGIVAINLSSIHELSRRYGFYYTQNVLKNIGGSLKDFASDNLVVIRLYENWFALYVKGYDQYQELQDLAQRASALVEQYLQIERLVWGIGIVEIEEESEVDLEQLLTHLILTGDKSLLSNASEFEIVCFNQKLVDDTARENTLIGDLSRCSLDEGLLTLNYQPIVDLDSGEIWAIEALARLNSPTLGPLAPTEFIPLAEKTKLIIPIGEEVFSLACHFLKRIHQAGYEQVLVSINISLIQIMERDFIQRLSLIMEECSIKPTSIILEITESAIAANHSEMNEILKELKALGFSLALDDFGTGYSSLARERELNVDFVKIDRIFIDRLLTFDKSEVISGDIISMAHKLGHQVIAEGVEHIKQVELLREFGCDKVQGFLFSKPLSEDEMLTLITQS
ncbi:MAG: EAL domain-containing protein [Sphaerochaetaceae bacterium]|nr:EAL domain-containing protein [Sphaerochaetaceae bacterium]